MVFKPLHGQRGKLSVFRVGTSKEAANLPTISRLYAVSFCLKVFSDTLLLFSAAGRQCDLADNKTSVYTTDVSLLFKHVPNITRKRFVHCLGTANIAETLLKI